MPCTKDEAQFPTPTIATLTSSRPPTVPFLPAPFVPLAEPLPLLIYVASCGPKSLKVAAVACRPSCRSTVLLTAGYSARRPALSGELLPDMPDPLTYGEYREAGHRVYGRSQQLEVAEPGPLCEEQAPGK